MKALNIMTSGLDKHITTIAHSLLPCKQKNIQLVLCAWVYKEYEICRGWEVYSGICVPKI